MSDKKAGLLELVAKFVFSTPKTAGAAIWRGVALWMVSLAASAGYLVTQTEFVAGFFSEGDDPLHQVVGDRRKRDQVIKLIESFAFQSKPNRIALVAKTSSVGVKLAWSSENLDTPWPTSVDGILSDNIRPLYGHLIFDDCWHGQFDRSTKWYMLCGISDSTGEHTGFLIAEKDKSCAMFEKDFRTLARRISEILF